MPPTTLKTLKRMKIQIASDLHLEFIRQRFPAEQVIRYVEGTEVLILAGDIHIGVEAVRAFKDWPCEVMLVPGNHEFYGGDRVQVLREMRRHATFSKVTVLDRDQVVRQGRNGEAVRFIGATLWTDFRVMKESGVPAEAAMRAVKGMSDYRLIREGAGMFSAERSRELHSQSREYLAEVLATPFEGRTVVISHHGAHPRSIEAKYAGDPTNGGFVSDCAELLDGRADLWVHGHVHSNHDYIVGGTRVVANPRGYPLNLGMAVDYQGIRWENPGFSPTLTVDLDAALEPKPKGRTAPRPA